MTLLSASNPADLQVQLRIHDHWQAQLYVRHVTWRVNLLITGVRQRAGSLQRSRQTRTRASSRVARSACTRSCVCLFRARRTCARDASCGEIFCCCVWDSPTELAAYACVRDASHSGRCLCCRWVRLSSLVHAPTEIVTGICSSLVSGSRRPVLGALRSPLDLWRLARRTPVHVRVSEIGMARARDLSNLCSDQ